jgi:fructokinase
MPDVISLGEIVVDIFADPISVPLRDATKFTAALGGAPANVAVALARLGVSAGFIGKAGEDPFGDRYMHLFRSEGVDTTLFQQIHDSPTPVAFVATSGPNVRDFILYHGADTKLRPEDIDPSYISSAKLFLYGSVTLTGAGKAAAVRAVELAQQSGVLVIYDANYRAPIWPNLSEARNGILKGMEGVTILKTNEIELQLLSGTDDLSSGSHWLLDQGPILCLITLGPKGAYYNNGVAEGFVPPFPVDAIDTTGCGDAFIAGFIHGLLDTSLDVEDLDETTLHRLVRYANAVGACTATTQGAMAALPTREMVDTFLSKRQYE